MSVMEQYAEGGCSNNRIQARNEARSAKSGLGIIKRLGLSVAKWVGQGSTDDRDEVSPIGGVGRRQLTGAMMMLVVGAGLPAATPLARGETVMFAADYVRSFREISLTSSPTMTIRDAFDYGAVSGNEEMLFTRDRWYTITSLVGGEMGARVVNADSQLSWFFGVEVYDSGSWEKVGSAFSSGGTATVTWMSELDRVYWVRVYGEAFQTGYDLTMEAEGIPTLDDSGSEINSGSGAAVVGRHLFYNNSAFDGESASANAADDGAIAPDKTALLPGGVATFENYSSYHNGINGVMIDVVGLTGAPTVDDFRFRQGNSNDLGSWTAANSPSSITVRSGAGVSGSDRITLIWDDPVIGEESGINGAIHRNWLEVVVKSGGNIGLAAADTFYFGSAPGDTGDRVSDAAVSTADMLRIRINRKSLITPAELDDVYDINRDKRVNTMDMLLARLYRTTLIDSLQLLDLSYSGDALAASDALARRSAPESRASEAVSGAREAELASWGAAIAVESGIPILTFQGHEGVEYDVQWCSAIGDEWRPLNSEVVEYAPGQFRISGESLVGTSVFFRINPVRESQPLAAY